MKKYVLNIEKLFTGETANALVLNQVDEELPTLIPSIDEDMEEIPDFIHKWKSIYQEFNPPSETDRSAINEYIIDFNLNLQDDFKKRGHQELYLMDDTKWRNPTEKNSTFATDKVNMHLLNGETFVDTNEMGEDKQRIKELVNSSQLNVLFPFKKVSSKSLYSEQLTVESPYEIDNKMERSRQMSLQGKDSSEKSLQGIANVGGNLYVMSPLVESKTPSGNLIANGTTIVNSFIDKPYHFPHTMTLFQPSGDRYDDTNLAKDDNGLTSFITWYKNHNRKTVVSIIDDYGNNVSKFNCLGSGSYELELATYSPTGIRLYSGEDTATIPLNIDKFREIRSDSDDVNKYRDFVSQDEDGNYIHTKKYVFDNGNTTTTVGFDFNLYDNFITGNERNLRLTVPKDKDFNQLHLRFECDVHHDKKNLLGEYEYIVFVDDYEAYRFGSENKPDEQPNPNVDIPIRDAVLESHSFDIKVIVHYRVDFSRRNNEKEYQDLLKNSGISLKDIRIDNDIVETKRQLTFSDYVNEVGISKDEHDERYEQFWQVSQYKKDVPYQLIVETSLKNMSSAGISYPNNYSTGDIYGDVFATKSVLDSNYNMNLSLDVWNDRHNRWATEDEKEDDNQKGFLMQMIRATGREYINIGQCSSQLFLVFKPTDIAIGYDTEWKDLDNKSLDPDERIITRRS